MSPPAKLPTRKIGKEDVTAIGYGAMSYDQGTENFEERLKIFDAVYESGCTNWDTADIYSDSELLIGEWFKRTGKRSEIFLATKFGFFLQPDRLINGDPEYVKTAVEKSLKRLGTDYIDLLYLHRADHTVPIEKTVGAMVEFVKSGKVKYLGLSEVSAATLKRANAIHPISTVQVEYSPFTLDIEDPQIAFLAAARELSIPIVAYSPLGRGLLTGKYKSPKDFPENDFRRITSRYSEENFPNILALIEDLKAVGDKHGATPGQVALAWLLAQGDDIIPIPGTRQVKYLKENMAALDLVLTQDDIDAVRKAALKADKVKVGERYPMGMIQASFADTPPL